MRQVLLGLIVLLTACSPAGGTVVDEVPTSNAPATTGATTGATTTAVPTTTAAPATTTTTTTTSAPVVAEPVIREVFVWMPGGLTEGFPEIVAAVRGVEAVSVITSVTMHLESSHKADGTIVDQPRAGYVIPLHGAIVEPDGLERVYGLPRIGLDEIILGEDSAELRRLRVGDTMTFETGATLTVGAVVPEDQMAGYEAIASSKDHFVEQRMKARAMLVLYDSNPNLLDLILRPRVGEDDVYAVRERNNSADDGGLVVRSQVFIKQHFGEFAYRPRSNGTFVIDPQWIQDNIVDVRIPLLGQTKCHRFLAEILTDVMQDLVDSGLSNVVSRRDYAGCWNGRYIAGSFRLSRHAFGAAADINIFNSTDGGPGSPVNEELLSRMYAAGMTSGHVWTNPDPGHFEYFGFPDQE